MDPGERVLPVARDVLVEGDVLIVVDLAGAAGPQRGVLVGPLVADDDRPLHVVAVLGDDLAQSVGVAVLDRLVAQVQDHVGAAVSAVAVGQLVGLAAVAHPVDRGGVGQGREAAHLDLLGHHERRVEADAELADQALGRLAALFEHVREGLGARARDRAEVLDRLGAGQADAVVADRDGLLVLVDGDLDAGLAGGGAQVGARQALETGPVQRVARVADQLAEEDLAVGVEAVGDQVQDLADVRLEAMALHGGSSGHSGPHDRLCAGMGGARRSRRRLP